MRERDLVFEEYNREGTLPPISYAFEQGIGVPGRVMQTHEPYVANDARHDPWVIPAVRDELGLNNLINVPVLSRSGELLGCFELHDTRDRRPLDGQDVEMLQGLASLAAVALENACLLAARAEADAGLRRSEERYRIVAETATDAIIIIDETNRIVFVNSATTCMFGYEIQELLGQPLTKLMPERLRSVHTQSFRRYLDTGQRHTAWDRLDVRGLHKCGIEFPIEISLGEQQQDGRHQFTAFIRDMTARTQAEESARQAREQLAHASRLRTIGEMASVLAHEINQPLAALSNFAQGCVQRLRAGHYKEADLLDAMEQITTQARRAGEIISRVRRFARARAPRQRAVDINDVVREAVELTEVEFRRDGLSTRLELAENLPPVDADGIELQQVIVNLVHNGYEACGHTDHRERPLVVRTSRGARDRIEVAVRDFGSGLPDGPPDHVFEPFFTTKQDGMGMGLSISRSIIEAYGGQLVATPNRDRGTRFTFSLPAGGGWGDGK